MINTNDSIGVNLKRLRKDRKLTQSDVAKKLQSCGSATNTTQYGHMEQGRKNIFVSDLILLAEIFQVDFNEFFLGLEAVNREIT